MFLLECPYAAIIDMQSLGNCDFIPLCKNDSLSVHCGKYDYIRVVYLLFLGWQKRLDQSGRPYFQNHTTGESTYTAPTPQIPERPHQTGSLPRNTPRVIRGEFIYTLTLDSHWSVDQSVD